MEFIGKIRNKKNIALIISFLLLIGILIPMTQAKTNIERVSGFDKGPSSLPVVPMKKTTFVGFDKDSILDDYAFLASVPTSVFQHDNKLFSHPLLFFDDKYDYENDWERTLNPRQGLDYFMEDYMNYSNSKLDQMTLVNVPINKINKDKWNAEEYIIIEGDNPYNIANQIAKQDWSYSDDIVISVIKEKYENPQIVTSKKTKGVFESCNVDQRSFEMQRPVIGTGATYETFDINNQEYKYVLTKMSWEGKEDYDLQIYDPELGMVETAFNSYGSPYPFSELVGSFVYNYGEWEVSVSAQAKKSASNNLGTMESMCYYTTPEPTLLSSLFNTNTVDIEIALLPGITVPLEPTPYGCRDIEISLDWDNPNANLGFTVLDPIGTEIASSFKLSEASQKCLSLKEMSENPDGSNNEITLNLEKFGETLEEEHYSVCIFSIGDLKSDVNYNLEYSWSQNFTKAEGDGLESACNGAVLASCMNTPLLYTNPKSLSSETKKVLYKLGVENIYIVDLGGHLSNKVKDELKEIANVKKTFTKSLDLFNAIRDKSGANDVVFSTIEPWDYWYVGHKDLWGTTREPVGQWDGAYHFGQAAYLAAHHGSPVIIVDNHPVLDQATTWATDWWRLNAYNRFNLPSAGAMTLTAKRAYEFLEENEFGKVEVGGPEKQVHETIITVAGQFDIGVPWDRSFTGAGLNGRFWGHPVDSAYAICRNIFYPALIFENAAMNKVTLTQGSESTSKLIGGRISKPFGSTLKITKPMQEEEFEYPVLQTYLTCGYRYNEESWKHFNCKYTRADGIIPYDTPSPDPIDEGVAHGKTSAYYPDMSESETIPIYCEKAGYDNVFSTNFEYITKNLNDGVLIWCSNIHGSHFHGGGLEIWDPANPYCLEENPWRAYEPIGFKLGNLDEFIRWLGFYGYHIFENMGNEIPILETLSKIPIRPIELAPEHGATDNPDVAFLNPQLTKLNEIFKPISPIIDVWGPWPFMIYRTRLLHPIETIKQGLPFFNWADGDGKICHSPPSGGRMVGSEKTGIDFDDALKNVHSTGINSISCLPAFTYLHLTWMRHGTTYQIIDPWTTTDWAGIWQQMLIKLFAMGYTVGEAYERGLRACGPLYSCGQSWWDLWENVVYAGDPDLRVFVPNTDYTDYLNGYEENHWTEEETRPISYDQELNINGHMPFGATAYPHAKQPESDWENYFIYIILVIILVIIILIVVAGRSKKSKGKK